MSKPEDSKRDPHLQGIQKVGAAIVRDGQVLVLRKKGQPTDEYYMAGGKMEEGETQKDTLARELDEELGVKVGSFKYLGSYQDEAVFEKTPILIHAYYVETMSEPQIANEVKEYAWIDARFAEKGIPLSSIMAKRVIPELVRLGLM